MSPGTREEKAVHEHFPIYVTYKSLDLAISKNYPGHVVFYSIVLTLHQEISKITYQFHNFFFLLVKCINYVQKIKLQIIANVKMAIFQNILHDQSYATLKIGM